MHATFLLATHADRSRSLDYSRALRIANPTAFPARVRLLPVNAAAAWPVVEIPAQATVVWPAP